ncbi:biotin/lipoyl-binding protein [Phenylobacterium sp.]|uniref:biotin/lipoyl-binding protein n=1 Tax=Phenylobacterium sp. TaxID=1871053 RepID=UPI00391DF79E
MLAKTDTQPENAGSAQTRRLVLRRRLFLGLAAAVVAAGAGVTAYGAVFGGRHVKTDNAYVGADIAEVTPLVAGPVREVRVADAQAVKRGDVLVVLDDSDARLALARAEADLAAAERRVRGLMATDQGLAAQVSARIAADAAAAQAAYAQAMAKWEADVKACKAGDKARCAPGG